MTDSSSDDFDALLDALADFDTNAPVESTGAPAADEPPAPQDLQSNLDDILGALEGFDTAIVEPPVSSPGTPDPVPDLRPVDQSDVKVADDSDPSLTALIADSKAAIGVVDGGALTPPSRSIIHRVLIGSVATAVLISTNLLSYYLGSKPLSAGPGKVAAHQVSHNEAPVPPPVQGLERYVGRPNNALVEGKPIFESEEIKSAIAELDGGIELQSEIATAFQRHHSVTPIGRSGATIQVRSCNMLDCAKDNVRIDYHTSTNRVSVCMTKPYSIERSLSYAYNQFGFQEVTGCEGDPFPKAPK